MLLYDLTATQPIGDIARHGGGIYGEMVLFNLVKKSSNFACYYDSKRWINPRIIEECNKSNIKIYDINDVSLEDLSKRFTHIYSALPNISTQKVPIHKIFTLHGLRDLETPLDSFIPYYTRSWKNKLKYYIKLLCKAKLKKRSLARIKDIYLYDKKNVEIITVSNHSRAAIEILIPEICNYKIPIKTFYSPEISQDSSHEIVNYPKHTSNCNFPFFLIVSGNRWIKNSVRALIAFDELVEEGLIKNTIFKVAGATKEDIDYKFKHVDKIEFLGYIDDRELNQLYRDASLLVYPSLNEGFGYPPLTAMKLLTPVIASCFTSIPEICGDGAMYFNPLSITEIKNRMLQMQDEKIKEIYINKGKIQFEKIVERQKIDLNAMTDYLLSYEKSKGIRLEKNKYDFVYNARIFLLWSAYILICIQYFLSWHIEGSDVICRYLTASCLILSFKYEKVNFFKIFLFIFLIVAFVFRRFLIVWCLYAMVYQFIDYCIPLKKIVKIAIIVLSIIFIVLIDGILMGLFENEGEIYIKSTEVIYDLGTGNANRCASLFFKFVILLYLLLKNKHPYYLICYILIISYIGYNINGSRAVLATSLLLAFLSILYWNNGFRNWMKYLIASFPILMYFLTFYLAFNLEDFKEFNKIASGRLWYIMKFTQDFTLKDWLFGAPRTIDDPLDSSYLEIIHTGGICLAFFFCTSYFITIINDYKKITPFLPVMITMLVMGLSESILLRPTDISVIFWMIILQKKYYKSQYKL